MGLRDAIGRRLGGGRGHARDAFSRGYADERGLEYHGTDYLKEVTPLLWQGDDRWADHVMTGVLPGGVPGILAFYTYADHVDDGQGELRAVHHPYTVVTQNLPDVAGFVNHARCAPRTESSPKEKALRSPDMRELKLESIKIHRRYAVHFGSDDSEVWMKRLFIPTFVDWLADRSPDGFAFEVWEGGFCAYVPGHLETADQLDELCKAASIAGDRLAWEAAEGLPGGAVGRRLDRG